MGNFKRFGVQYWTQGSTKRDILGSFLTFINKHDFVECLKDYVPRFLGLSAFICVCVPKEKKRDVWGCLHMTF